MTSEELPTRRAELHPGLCSELVWVVTLDRTAAGVGHADVEVFSTPHMGLLAELASAAALRGTVPEGMQHVGTLLEVHHLAATPVGFSVTAHAELIEVEGPKLTFRIEVFDNAGKVGHVIHRRRLVNWQDFLHGLERRKAQGR